MNDFNDCIKKRIAKEIIRDDDLIQSLKKTSNNRYKTHEKIKLDDESSASIISLLYDSLRELLEALSIKNGYKIYNHECYTFFLKEILNEDNLAEEFDSLRRIRNNINYYGKEITLIDAKDVILRLKNLRNEILKILT